MSQNRFLCTLFSHPQERMGQACTAMGASEQADSCNERARLLLEAETQDAGSRPAHQC